LNLTLNFGESQAVEKKPVVRNPLVRQDASLERAVEQLEALRQHENSPITAIRRQPARPANFVTMPSSVDARLGAVLAQRGIAQLYSHQAEAYERIAAGENIVIVTPTASGKTLCYNLPVLNALLEDSQACALYLFPTKALSEDQLDEFHGLVEAMGTEIRAFT
jgi:DEAD/DEAH box helicase domain-containing protein